MSYKEFFDKHADHVIYTTTFHAGQTTRLEPIGSVEYLYQMLKARMMEEMKQESKQITCDYQSAEIDDDKQWGE